MFQQHCSIKLDETDDLITCVAVGPTTGAFMACATKNGYMRVWKWNESSKADYVCGIQVHKSCVHDIKIDPSNEYCVCTCGGDKTIKIWSIEYEACIRTLKGHTSDVLTIDWSNDGSRCVSGSNDETIRLWDTSSGALVRVYPAHTKSVTCVQISQRWHIVCFGWVGWD